MSGTFPTSPGVSTIDLESNQPSVISKAESGKSASRLTGGHLWSLRLSFPVMNRSEFSVIDAFIMGQDGGYGTFYYTYPLANQGAWINSATPKVNGAVTAGDTSLNIDGLAAGETITAGDILTAGHTKVYKVITGGTAGALDELELEGSGNLELEGSGNLTLEASYQVDDVEVRPAFIADVADNTVLSHTDVTFLVRHTQTHDFKISAPELYKYELDLEEAIL